MGFCLAEGNGDYRQQHNGGQNEGHDADHILSHVYSPLLVFAGVNKVHLLAADVQNFKTFDGALGGDGDAFLGAGADFRSNGGKLGAEEEVLVPEEFLLQAPEDGLFGGVENGDFDFAGFADDFQLFAVKFIPRNPQVAVEAVVTEGDVWRGF